MSKRKRYVWQPEPDRPCAPRVDYGPPPWEGLDEFAYLYGCPKVTFQLRDAANHAAIRYMEYFPDEVVEAYLCELCGKYHVGHVPEGIRQWRERQSQAQAAPPPPAAPRPAWMSMWGAA